MGLDFAIDALYDTGWQHADVKDLPRHAGRAYPAPNQIVAFFHEHGFELIVRHIQVFDCYRAEWRDQEGLPHGAVVGQSADEAAVYAMSQLRRHVAAKA